MFIHLKNRKAGQAMIEFCIGLIAVMVIVAALVQLVLLTTAHHRTMAEARIDAGQEAMIDVGSLFDSRGNPEFLRNWQVGPDGKRYTADDVSEAGDAVAFDRDVTGHSAADSAGWTVLDGVGGNRMSFLHGVATPQITFGLVKGEESESVEVLSTVRSLFYNADKIEMKSTVWMTRLKGIY